MPIDGAPAAPAAVQVLCVIASRESVHAPAVFVSAAAFHVAVAAAAPQTHHRSVGSASQNLQHMQEWRLVSSASVGKQTDTR